MTDFLDFLNHLAIWWSIYSLIGVLTSFLFRGMMRNMRNEPSLKGFETCMLCVLVWPLALGIAVGEKWNL